MATIPVRDQSGRVLFNASSPAEAEQFARSIGIAQTPRQIGFQESTPSAATILNREAATGVGQNVPSIPGGSQSQVFGMALMDLLRRYQTLGTRPAVEQQFGAQQQQIQRVAAQTPSQFIGASPSVQAQVRAASAGALQPTIQGAQQAGQTYSEQLRSFGDTLGTARSLIKDFEASEAAKRDDARTSINQALTLVGGSAFEGLDPVEISQLEKIAGYPKGYLTNITKTLKERELELKRQTRTSTEELGPVSFSGVPGVIPTQVSPQPVAPTLSYEDYIRQRVGNEVLARNAISRGLFRQDYQQELQKLQTQPISTGVTPMVTPQADISKFDPTVQLVIGGYKSIDSIGEVEYRRIKGQLNQAIKLGLIKKEDTLSEKAKSRVDKITGQFDTEQSVKNYQVAAETVDAVRSAGTSPTDDIQRIYGFARVMDPGSAVKEGEYKTVQDYATALLQRYGLKAKRVFTNTGFLTPEARKFLLATLDNRLKSSKKAYDNIYKEYGRRVNQITGKTDGTEYLTDYSRAFPEAAGRGGAADILRRHGVPE